MSRRSNKIMKSVAPALVVAAAVAPTASAQYQDLRSPDARDAAYVVPTHDLQDLRSPDAQDGAALAEATSASQPSGYADLRSPDAQAAAHAVETSAAVDLRSPDARDAGHVGSTLSSATASGDSGGFDWGDGAIVGGSVLGLTLLALGGMVLFSRRRGALRRSQTAVVSS